MKYDYKNKLDEVLNWLRNSLGILGEKIAETIAELKVDLLVFFANIKAYFSSGNEEEETPRTRALSRIDETDDTYRRRRGETVRSQSDDSRGGRQPRNVSATRSKYDGDYARKKSSPKPTWIKVTKAITSILMRGMATVLLITVMTGCIVGAAGMIYVLAFLEKDLDFDLYSLKLRYTSVIYVQNDEGVDVEYQKLHGSENRIWVEKSEIPAHVLDAMVSIEDKRFWTHKGVDWIRTGRAFLGMFGDGDVQGGSTIDQQLIKNVTGDDSFSVERKIKEIFRALELEKKYSKDIILETYLNVISFGNGCNGIESASQTYFNKHVSDLTVAEGAAIVGITKNPTKYNPLYRPEENEKRKNQVLYAMYENGVLSEEEYEAAKAEELVFNEAAKYNPDVKSYNNWYVDQIIYDLINDFTKNLGMSEVEAKYQVYNGGLQIYSNMDADLQKKAEDIFKSAKNFIKFPGKTQPECSIAVMNYEGEVKAIVGARGTKQSDLVLNMASQSQRQPGSAFKPVSVYGPAIELGLLEYSTPVSDSPSLVISGKAWPKNSGGVYRGNIPAVKGVEVSANCVAVRVYSAVGYERGYKFMTDRLSFNLVYNRKVKTKNGTKVQSDTNPSTCLGALTDGVSVLEMTAAYATFGNGGKFYEPTTYSKVKDAQGNTIIDNTKAVPTQAFSKETAVIMNHMLRTPITGANGTARKAKVGKHTTFGKTGTTSDDKDRYFAGGTSYYVAACWFGYKTPKELTIKYTNHAMDAWKKIMTEAHKGLKAKAFSTYNAKVYARSYCAESGGIAGPGCKVTAVGYYKGNSQIPICPLHSGGTPNAAYTRFLTDKDAFTGESTTDENSTTTSSKAQTTPPPVITTPTKSTTTTTTKSTTTKTTATTTKAPTTPAPTTPAPTTPAPTEPDPTEPPAPPPAAE
ncbi:MAG: transglycosylase domain-containing protein [Oscillospiraceae bacterium]|jgi:penicillin-binding protein 1A|nr:transglycosylase domain-containing protein [Oscillospiraceae bacterium]